MSMSVSRCPVPLDQQPVNEYQSLRESWFFRWSTQAPPQYLRCLSTIWISAALLMTPLAADSFAPEEAWAKFLLASAGGATLVVSLILLRLYLGWAYVCDRLLREQIPYEETGWYDGQSWTKPPEEITKDRLIGIYEVRPLLQRLRLSFGGLGLGCVAGWLVWHWL
ncbi:CGLD27 family protein [Synechococcales cyanobacterium C]|uniref:CGLD27 family protein n=1 Tax=Petrachloros mirabilis ULC683 TaxID=2781853 RepID=A0A8K2A0U4_9CYAN|nr:CGLD27 family protein [Petrachloros mirabilis]NCJ07511.1 CGLD27 family protein [Petrachloros mirabilis ULC683]